MEFTYPRPPKKHSLPIATPHTLSFLNLSHMDGNCGTTGCFVGCFVDRCFVDQTGTGTFTKPPVNQAPGKVPAPSVHGTPYPRNSFALCLDSVRSTAKNRSSKRGARRSSIDHQLDRIDVRRILRSQEKHSLREFFRFAPSAQTNRRGVQISPLGKLFSLHGGARPPASRSEFWSLPARRHSRECCAAQSPQRSHAPWRPRRPSWPHRRLGRPGPDSCAPIR